MSSHCIDLSFKVVSKLFQFVFELRLQRLQCILNSLLLGAGEVAIRLDLPGNILKLGLQLLSRLDLFTEHDIVVLVHLHHLLV